MSRASVTQEELDKMLLNPNVRVISQTARAEIAPDAPKAAKGEKIRVDKTTRENALKTILQEVTFVVPGEPIPKGRPRVMGKVTFTPKRTVAYERKVKVAAIGAMVDRERFEFSVTVEIIFYRKNRYRSDLDNLYKAVSDAMNGIVYDDDRQIDVMRAEMHFDYNNPRAEVTVSGKVLK